MGWHIGTKLHHVIDAVPFLRQENDQDNKLFDLTMIV